VEAFTGLTADVLFYASREAIRNAAQHARGHQPLNLKVTVSNETGFQIMIEDDGVGMLPTINTGEIKTGQGLALHSTLMAIIGGSLTVETKPAEYTRVILKI
jgi:signal transduction histidine kinase